MKGKTPLEFLVELYQNPKTEPALALQAAAAALPYFHRRMPVAIIQSVASSTVKRIILEDATAPLLPQGSA